MTGVPGWLETTLEVAGEALTRELMLTTSFEQGEPFAVVAGVVVAGMTKYMGALTSLDNSS